MVLLLICWYVWDCIETKIENKRKEKKEEIKKEIERIFPPEEFEHWEEKLLQDDELIALGRYSDEIRFRNENKLEAYLNKIKNEKYIPRLHLFLGHKSTETEIDKLIDIDEVSDILCSLHKTISLYEFFLKNIEEIIQKNEPEYSLSEPVKPNPIKVPPCWSRWSYTEKEFNDDIYKDNKYFLELLGKIRNLQNIYIV